MTRASGLVLGLVAGPEPADPLAQRDWPATLALLKLGVADVLVQPAREALAVFVDDVVGQPAHWAVHAGPLAHRAAVVLRVPAVDQPDHPRSAVPAAVPYPGIQEDQPEPVRRRPRTAATAAAPLSPLPVAVTPIHPRRRSRPSRAGPPGAAARTPAGRRTRARPAPRRPRRETARSAPSRPPSRSRPPPPDRPRRPSRRHRAMLTSSSRVSTTTLTGTLPGGGSSPARHGRRPSLVTSYPPASSRSTRSGSNGSGSGAIRALSAVLVACLQRVHVTQGVTAQRWAGDLAVLRRVPGDDGHPVDPRLCQRAAERLKARRKVHGPAAGPQIPHLLDVRAAPRSAAAGWPPATPAPRRDSR